MTSSLSYQDYIAESYPNAKGVHVSMFSCTRKCDGISKCIGAKSDIDAEYLEQVFNDLKINAEVKLIDDESKCTKDEIKKYIGGLSGRETNDYDIFVFVFLTYSADDQICLYDKHPCSMQEFYDTVKMVEGMQLKPKIFLVQCDDLSHVYPGPQAGGVEPRQRFKIPQDSDRLVIMSDIPQSLANPKNATGKNPSFMIKAFGETLRENSEKEPMDQQDLMALTTSINCKVSSRILQLDDKKVSSKLSVPLVTSTLTKLVKIPLPSQTL